MLGNELCVYGNHVREEERVDGDRMCNTKLKDRMTQRPPALGILALKTSSISGRALHPLPALRLVFFREAMELLSYPLSNTMTWKK